MKITEAERIESVRKFRALRFKKKGVKLVDYWSKINIPTLLKIDLARELYRKTYMKLSKFVTEDNVREHHSYDYLFFMQKNEMEQDEQDQVAALMHSIFKKKLPLENIVSYNLGFNMKTTRVYGVEGYDMPSKYQRSEWKLKSQKRYFYSVHLQHERAKVFLNRLLLDFAYNNPEEVRTSLLRDIVALRKAEPWLQEFIGTKEILDALNDLKPGITGPLNSEGFIKKTCELKDFYPQAIVDFIEGKTSLPEPEENNNILNIICLHSLRGYLKLINRIEDDVKSFEESFVEYAKSWSMKKNIPLKVQQAAKHSIFNDYYAEVEFDAEADLEKVAKIAEEFNILAQILSIPKSEGSFRIRKLGHHRAHGVYFPFHKATVIDLDGMHATMHEYFHQLDYTFLDDDTRLSELSSFNKVYALYERAVEQRVSKLDACDPFLIDWNSNKKYNRDYYLRETEVFARCGEIYLRQELNIESSLVKYELNPVIYPDNEELLLEISKYFNHIFPNAKLLLDIAN